MAQITPRTMIAINMPLIAATLRNDQAQLAWASGRSRSPRPAGSPHRAPAPAARIIQPRLFCSPQRDDIRPANPEARPHQRKDTHMPITVPPASAAKAGWTCPHYPPQAASPAPAQGSARSRARSCHEARPSTLRPSRREGNVDQQEQHAHRQAGLVGNQQRQPRDPGGDDPGTFISTIPIAISVVPVNSA